jgi:hypothetical protein
VTFARHSVNEKNPTDQFEKRYLAGFRCFDRVAAFLAARSVIKTKAE